MVIAIASQWQRGGGCDGRGWDCRGLETTWTVKALQKLLISQALDLVFLMDRWKKVVETQNLRGITRLQNIYVVGSRCFGKERADGYLALLWSDSVIIRNPYRHMGLEPGCIWEVLKIPVF